MNAIMGENELLQRFEEYKDKGAEIISLYHPEDCTVEFGRGGREMDRGYYCPSPILDFLVGGLNRGRLLKRQPSPETYDWVYYRDKTGALVIVDKYMTTGNRSKETVLSNREIVLHQTDRELSLNYNVMGHMDAPKLSKVTMCRYSDGKILSFAYLFVSYSSQFFHSEQYEYDTQTGLMSRVFLGDKDVIFQKTYERSEYYQLNHNEDGCVVSYQLLRDTPEGFEPYGQVYEPYKSKQRII